MPGNTLAVVFINHWAKNVGGAERSLLDILEYIAPRCRTFLITSEQGPLTEKASQFGVQCRIVPCSLRPQGKEREHFLRFLFHSWSGCVSFVRYALAVSRIVKSIKPDCIHTNVPKSHVTLFLLSLLGCRGAYCFHLREIFVRGSVPYLMYAWLFPYKQGRIIAISEAVKRNLPARMQAVTTVIYNGVSVPQEEHRMPRQPVRFLYLGRVVPWKGCHHLIDIFALMRKKYPSSQATLTLIGDTLYWSSDYREELQSKIRDNGLAGECFLLPHTDDPAEAFDGYDVFCNASRSEPFGRSIAEAQAAAMPVVAYAGGGVAEIVEHEKTGIIVSYGDAGGFADAMKRLIDNPSTITEMGLWGRKRATELFNREIQVSKICGEILGGELAPIPRRVLPSGAAD